MVKKALILSLTVLTLPATVGLAHADLCISISGSTLVADGLAIPPRGRCRPLLGHFRSFPDFMVTGTACTSSDGHALKVMWTDYDGGTYVDFNRADIPLPLSPSTPGTVHILAMGTPGVATASGPATAETCNPRNQPVP